MGQNHSASALHEALIGNFQINTMDSIISVHVSDYVIGVTLH